MPRLLVSDTSVLIDLERGNLLQATFKLPTPLVVPDVLYERELSATSGPMLKTLGLQVLASNAEQVSLAQEYLSLGRGLSVPDAFALALAKTGGQVLACGDHALRTLATSEAVECHGVLWIIDELLASGLITAVAAKSALERITKHPRCRLTHDLVARHIAKWSK